VLALGLFADGTYGDGLNGVPGTVRGLFYGDPSQFLAEVIGVTACVAFCFPAFYLALKAIGATIGNRVPAEVEIEGLDLEEMGILGYPVADGIESAGGHARPSRPMEPSIARAALRTAD
jgi:Amt family ammonium transporter